MNKTNQNIVSGTVFDKDYVLKKMINHYHKYGKIIVAYDFDGTVHPEHPEDEQVCEMIRDLLEECSKYDDFAMIVSTCRGDDTIEDVVIPYLDFHGIRHDKINEQSDSIDPEIKKTLSTKIMCDIFLDNYAGLDSTYSTLCRFLMWLKVFKGESCISGDFFIDTDIIKI